MEALSARLPSACRIAIAGAGLAGLELARELERRGVRDIVVLEAGPDHDRRHVNAGRTAEDALRQWLEPAADPYFHRSWTSRTPPHYTGPSGLRQRLGGRSLYWYGVILPLEDWALTEPWWPREVITDLRETWRGGPSLYQRLTDRFLHWQDPASPAATGPGAPAVTVGELTMRPTPRAVRGCAGDTGQWYAYSPLEEWWDPETGAARRAARGITWVPGAEVTEAVVRDGRCLGLRFRSAGAGGPVTELRAETVVLAAGTLENSRLAIRALHQAGPAPVTRLGGLADHIVQGVLTRLTGRQARRFLDAAGPGSYVAPGPAEVRSNLFLDIRRLPGGDALLDLKAMGEQEPSPDSYVECPAGAAAALSVHSVPSRRDREMLAMQRELLTVATFDLAAMAGFRAARPVFADYADPVRTNAVLLEKAVADLTPGASATWANSLGTEDHEGGTLPLGGVLTSEHEFKAVPGLFAVGPAVFPRMGAANPSLTSLALTHRLAALLAA